MNAAAEIMGALRDSTPVVERRGRYPLGWRCIREAAILAVAAMLPAMALAFYSGETPEPEATAQAIPADALWIDARSEAEFERGHVPGAVNLNEENWETGLVKVFETWQPPRPIVVYCSAGCSSGEKIAAKLTELGIEPVEVYQGGFEKWKQSNG